MKTYLKILFYFFTGVITISCFYVLLVSHPDKLVKFVPAEANLYIHTRHNFLDKIPENQKKLLTEWLAHKSTLTQNQWQEIMQEKNKEFALFSLNGQIFGLTQDSDSLQTKLHYHKINFTKVNDILFIPALKPSQKFLLNEDWFKQTKKRFYFSKFQAYIKNPRALDIPNSLTNTNELPIAINETSTHTDNCYNLYGQIGFSSKKTTAPQLYPPPETNIYFNNIPTNTISQKVDYSLNNLPLLLLKTLFGGIEFISDNQNFIIRTPKDQNNLDTIKNNIQFILAQTNPLEKTKLLPDKTTSIQLIADPSQFNFSSVDNKYQQIKTNLPKYEINILETDKDYYIFNNFQLFKVAQIPTNYSKQDLTAKKTKGIIYIQPQKTQDTENLSAIWILNHNPTKISICLK